MKITVEIDPRTTNAAVERFFGFLDNLTSKWDAKKLTWDYEVEEDVDELADRPFVRGGGEHERTTCTCGRPLADLVEHNDDYLRCLTCNAVYWKSPSWEE